MNQIKPLKLAVQLFCAVLLFVLTASAQTSIENSAIDFSQSTLKIKAQFTSVKKTEDDKLKIYKREFSAAKKSNQPAPENAAKQQTYVRPTKDERLKRYASDAFGVPALIGATFGATLNQIGNDPPEWERTVGGFGKRFASAYGTNAIRNTISFGLSEAFQLDNKFEKSGQKSVGKRLKHVFLGSYTTRTKTGKRLPDFPHFTGTYSAAIIANEAWFPDRFSYKDGLRDGTISLGVRFGVNLLREFIFPK